MNYNQDQNHNSIHNNSNYNSNQNHNSFHDNRSHNLNNTLNPNAIGNEGFSDLQVGHLNGTSNINVGCWNAAMN